MQAKLLGYNSGSRFLLIDSGLIKDDGMLIDGRLVPVIDRDKNILRLFNIGDVVFINEYGVVQRVYESELKDLELLMTIHCNSNCIMCPISEGARQTDESGYVNWVKEFIRFLPSDIEHICITGGEPTLIRDKLFGVLDMIKEKYENSSFQFLTNGRSCGSSSFCKQLVDHLPNNTLFGIPIHADVPLIHDMISQTEGSFFQTVQGIKNLLLLEQDVEVRIVVSRLNANCMGELADFIIDQFSGIRHVAFMGLEMMGNAVKNMDEVWIPYEEATRSCEPAMKKLVASGIDVMLYNFPLCMIDKNYWFLAKRSITPHKVRFYKQCDECEVKAACGGFFQSTKNVEDIEVHPVKKNENELF